MPSGVLSRSLVRSARQPRAAPRTETDAEPGRSAVVDDQPIRPCSRLEMNQTVRALEAAGMHFARPSRLAPHVLATMPRGTAHALPLRFLNVFVALMSDEADCSPACFASSVDFLALIRFLYSFLRR